MCAMCSSAIQLDWRELNCEKKQNWFTWETVSRLSHIWIFGKWFHLRIRCFERFSIESSLQSKIWIVPIVILFWQWQNSKNVSWKILRANFIEKPLILLNKITRWYGVVKPSRNQVPYVTSISIKIVNDSKHLV